MKAEHCQGESRAQKGHSRAPQTSPKACPASKKYSQVEHKDVQEPESLALLEVTLSHASSLPIGNKSI